MYYDLEPGEFLIRIKDFESYEQYQEKVLREGPDACRVELIDVLREDEKTQGHRDALAILMKLLQWAGK